MESQQLNINAQPLETGYSDYQETYAKGEFLPEETTDTPQIPTPDYLADKYTFIRQLGQGAQGHVYLARRKQDNLEVALKELRIDSVSNWKEYELFQRESRVLATLNIHGVAKFYESLEFLDIEHPSAYIVQEYVHGHSLDDMLKAGYRFSLTRIYEMLIQIIDILEQLHNHNPAIIHRDLKPSNIILNPKQGDDFDIYIIDFGAVANPQVQSGGSTVAGTFGYMPPEQLMGKPVPASDIYSLGALAVHLITGVSPADMQIKDFHLVFEPHMQSMPIPLLSLIGSMLDPNTASRQCDYDYLRRTLQAFIESRYEEFIDKTQREQENRAIWESSKFNNQLEQVYKLGEAGNLEIWQHVPDTTPRNLPDIYQYAQLQKHRISLKELLSNEKLIRGSNKSIWPKAFAVLFGLILFISLVIGIASADFITFLVSIIFLVAGLFLSPIGWVILIAIFMVNNKSKIPDGVQNGLLMRSHFLGSHVFPTESDLNKSQMQSAKMHKLISNGRKTIATIIDIQYESANPNDIEKMVLKPPKRECTICAYHGVTTFSIRYKFNPPDDSSPYDLIHQIKVHFDPENTLHVGDPLPILYDIEKSGSKERVTSIPFPYPVTDIVNFNDIIGVSDNMI